jgi:hypothetical protein
VSVSVVTGAAGVTDTATVAEAEQPAVLLRDFTSLEYYYDKASKEIRLFATEHRIVRVNSSDGIESYNKIVVPVLASGAPVSRTILPRRVRGDHSMKTQRPGRPRLPWLPWMAK